MYKGLRIAAVVPAYNEEKLIARTIMSMPDWVDMIIVINDGSKDQTLVRAQDVNDPRVSIINHAKNTGVGGSIIDGHRLALELGSDVNVVMAGDGQMDPAYPPDLL